jgi:UDP:flavonoid glycosyltransferase YjiC (YdhE family)
MLQVGGAMKRGGDLRLLVAAFGDPGHAFPAIALGRELAARGHRVVIETWGRWREAVEEIGLEFRAAEEYRVFPPPDPETEEMGAAADAARALAPLLDELEPHLVVSDILTLAPALAAEVAGVPRATLIPHIYPVHEPGLPFFAVGVEPPRTAVGRWLWKAGLPLLETGLRVGRRELNEQRAHLGLPPQQRFHGGISEELVVVGTFPQLEYPRPWPREVTVTGPLHFELPYPDIELPGGDEPLVLVAPSTSHDPKNRLVRAALEGLADEPVRVVATTNRMEPPEPIPVPANAVLVDWLSYSQVMPQASLVISHGGHGTVARALAEGVPVLVSPAVGDMAETAARVSWAGVGLSVPWRLCRAGPLRWAVRELLREPGFAERAGRIQRWAAANDGARRAAGLVEAQAVQASSPRPGP